MESAVVISPKIRKVIRWIEWGLLFDALVANLLRGDVDYIPYVYWRTGICLIALAAYGLIPLPTQLPLRQRRSYVLAGFLLLIVVDIARVNYSSLFDLFIIKTCMLLSRKEAIVATVLAVGVNFALAMSQLPLRIEEARQIPLDSFLNAQKIFLDSLVSTAAITFFVLLLGFVFVAEQRSRHRAEQLTLEVESLATKLERSRIARDIHDSLGHTLTTLDVQLALVERYAQDIPQAHAPPKLHQSIKQSKQLAAQCLTEARQSLQTIRASNFDLEDSLRSLCTEMQHSFEVDLQMQLVRPLPQKVRYQLYLIAKEALINVQKHANATTVKLSLFAKDENLLLTIIDNGKGFDAAKEASGYGLQGIRERSQLLGGQLIVTSTPTKGTILQVTLPLPQTPQPSPNKRSIVSRQFT